MSNPTKLVSDFDESLAFTDAAGPGAWTPSGPVAYDDGLVLSSGGNPNLCTNGSFEVDLSGWVDQGSPTRTRVTTDSYSGDAAMRIQCSGTFQGARFDLTPTVAQHVASVYINGTAGDQVRLVLHNGINTTVFDTFTLATNEWERIYLPANILGTQLIGFYIDTGGVSQTVDWLVDAVKIELGSTPTDFEATSASVATADHIDPAAGSLALQLSRQIDTGAQELYFECGTVGSGTDAMRGGVDSSDHPFVEWNSNNAGWERLTSTATVGTGTEFVYLTDWTGTVTRLQIDDATIESGTRDAVEGDWGTGDLILEAA